METRKFKREDIIVMSIYEMSLCNIERCFGSEVAEKFVEKMEQSEELEDACMYLYGILSQGDPDFISTFFYAGEGKETNYFTTAIVGKTLYVVTTQEEYNSDADSKNILLDFFTGATPQTGLSCTVLELAANEGNERYQFTAAAEEENKNDVNMQMWYRGGVGYYYSIYNIVEL